MSQELISFIKGYPKDLCPKEIRWLLIDMGIYLDESEIAEIRKQS